MSRRWRLAGERVIGDYLQFYWGVLKLIGSTILASPAQNQPTTDTQAMVNAQIQGALLAASAAILAAILTGLVTNLLDRRKDKDERLRLRQVKHYNSVITAQWQFNEARAILENNTQAIEQIIATGQRGTLSPMRPQQLVVDHSYYDDLADLKLINLINDYNLDARRLNLDFANLNRAIDNLESLIINLKPDTSMYADNITMMEPGLKKLLTYMKETHEQVMFISAYARICADNDATQDMKEQYRKLTNGKGNYPDSVVREMKATIMEELDTQAANDIRSRDLKH